MVVLAVVYIVYSIASVLNQNVVKKFSLFSTVIFQVYLCNVSTNNKYVDKLTNQIK